MEGEKQIRFNPQYFPETQNLPPEYEEDDEVDYGLDDEDMDNEILNELGIQNYDSVAKVLNQPEMTQQKNRKYLNKIVKSRFLKLSKIGRQS